MVDHEYGYTALHWAARKGSAQLIKFLLDEGADVNASCTRGGNRGTTALMEATIWAKGSHPHIAAMKSLLGDDGNESADVNARRGDGATALCLAAWHGNIPAVQVLLDHKADPTIKFLGRTALQLARKAKRAATTREETKTFESLESKLVHAWRDWRLESFFRRQHSG